MDDYKRSNEYSITEYSPVQYEDNPNSYRPVLQKDVNRKKGPCRGTCRIPVLGCICGQ